MEIEKNKLIADLVARIQTCIIRASEFTELPDEALNWRPHDKSWTILECIAHLNLYAEFYLPEIKRALDRAALESDKAPYKLTKWGNFFVNAVLPQSEDELKKTKAFKHLNPVGQSLGRDAIDKFIKEQYDLMDLVKQAGLKNLKAIKTKSTIKFVKLRLGDTIRAEVLHNQRHINQATRILKLYRK